ncbi:unnamed protein product, partial [Iphiclides podalirius]
MRFHLRLHARTSTTPEEMPAIKVGFFMGKKRQTSRRVRVENRAVVERWSSSPGCERACPAHAYRHACAVAVQTRIKLCKQLLTAAPPPPVTVYKVRAVLRGRTYRRHLL